MQKQNKPKVWFAQMLRGIACLIVVYFHYLDLFWSKHDSITNLANVNESSYSSDLLILKTSSFFESIHINLGSVGVALFFIISGFVIPFSLKSSGKVSFLIKRFFRVVPPYAIGLLLTFMIVFIYAKVYGLTFPYTIIDYIVNASLLRDWIGFIPTIDGINWTLEMEIKFYILMAILSVFFSIKSRKSLILASTLLLSSVILYNFALDYLNIYIAHLINVISRAAIYLIFMMIGVCFHNYFKSDWSKTTFINMTSFLLITTFISMYLRLPDSYMEYIVSYGISFILFLVFYFLEDKLTYNPVLNFFADISYPLYILHGVIGYTLITVFYSYIPNPYIVVLIVFSIIILASYLHHKYIELSFNKLGYKVASKVTELREANKIKESTKSVS